jgi:hypothetical protein
MATRLTSFRSQVAFFLFGSGNNFFQLGFLLVSTPSLEAIAFLAFSKDTAFSQFPRWRL